MSLLKKSKNFLKSSKKSLRPGTYLSEIISVEDAPGYRVGDAFKIEYKLIDEKTSAEFKKSETFMNDLDNRRTSSLVEYLAQHGVSIQETEELVGIKEKLTFEFSVVNGERFLNVATREFIGTSEVI